VVGVSASDGQLLWRRPFSTEYAQNIIVPIVIDDRVIVGGYQKPTWAFRVRRKGNQWTPPSSEPAAWSSCSRTTRS